VVFTALFLNDPCLCYGVLCDIPSWDYINDNNNGGSSRNACTSRTRQKLPILKSLLACAALILVCNIVFIVIYLILSIRLSSKTRTNNRQLNVGYQQESRAIQMGGQRSYHPSTMPYSSHQHQQSYPIQYTQTPSAPLPYEMRASRF
jgi:hypothetical protein